MSEDQEQKPEQSPKQKTPKLSAEKALPYSGSDVIVKIIKGYVVASNAGASPVKYTDVASATGLSATTVSGNNSFLSESQILASPKYGYYVPSEEATRFAREAAWDEEKAKIYLRKVIARCWYGQVAIQNVTLRSSLGRTDLKKSLAIKAGATEGDSLALERLIDFIVYTGLLLQDNSGVLSKGNLDDIETPSPISQKTDEPLQVSAHGKANVYIQNREENSVSVVLHIHLKDWSDLTSENATRLREWLGRAGIQGAKLEAEAAPPTTSN